MARTNRLGCALALFILAHFTVGIARGQALGEELKSIKAAEAAIKPLPLTPIPDDPPPHEGAMINLPFTIEPPDLLIVEVLEALPGRRITGERLVRPDGTISLGF